jgi:hypothetical protein
LNKAELIAQKKSFISKNIWKLHRNFRGKAQYSPAWCKLSKCSRDIMDSVDLMEDKFELEIEE